MVDSESPVYSDFSGGGDTNGDVYSASGAGMLVGIEDGSVDLQEEEDGGADLRLHADSDPGSRSCVARADKGRVPVEGGATGARDVGCGSAGGLSVEEGDEIRDILTCTICEELMLPPLKQCVNGHLICNVCLEKMGVVKPAKSVRCPTCRVDGVAARNLMMERLAGKRKWACVSSGNGCKEMLEYCDMLQHRTVCRYNVLPCCPVEECDEFLCLGVDKVLAHFASKHAMLPEVSGHEDCFFFPSMVFVVHDFQKERVKRGEVFQSSKVLQMHSLYVLLTMIETETQLEFRSFFFTDEAGNASYTMQKTFSRSAAPRDELVLSENIKSLSSVNVVWSNRKKKQPTLDVIKNSLNNDSLVLNKNGLAATCYHHGTSTSVHFSVRVSKVALLNP